MYLEPIRSSKVRVLDTHFEEYRMELRIDDFRRDADTRNAELRAQAEPNPAVQRRLPSLKRVAAAWDELVALAQRRAVIEYAPLGERIGQMFPLAVGRPLDPIYRYCEKQGLPPLTVLVVNKGTGLPGPGFGRLGRDEFEALCTEVSDFDWQSVGNPFSFATMSIAGTDPITRLLQSPSAAEEVYRSVKDRGQGQLLFRELVFAAYKGRCAASGSAIRAGLEAAHIVPWSISAHARLDVRNGILLTAWHHQLFDAGILRLDEDYTLRIRPGAAKHSRFDSSSLQPLDGKRLRLPKNRDQRPDPALIRRRNELLAG